MRRNNDVLFPQLRIGAAEFRENVGRCDVALRQVQMDANVARDLEVGERLPGAPQIENGIGILPGAGEKGGERLSAEAHDGELPGPRHRCR